MLAGTTAIALQLHGPVNLGCPRRKIALEGGSVELREVGHEGQQAVALQPCHLGIERGIPAALPQRQPTPMDLPQLLDVLRCGMCAGGTLIQNLPNERSLLLDQCIDLSQHTGGFECGNAGGDPVEVDTIERGIMLMEHVAGAA